MKKTNENPSKTFVKFIFNEERQGRVEVILKSRYGGVMYEKNLRDGVEMILKRRYGGVTLQKPP